MSESVLDDYLAGFSQEKALFLSHYRPSADGFSVRHWTRAQFWQQAERAASRLQGLGLGPGDRQLHVFGANQAEDLIFRLAATMIGTVPVTVNWQADSPERVLFKFEQTEAKIIITGPKTEGSLLDSVVSKYPSVPIVDATADIPNQRPFDLVERRSEDERLIIFTSGTTGQPKGVRLSFRAYAANAATFEQFFSEPQHLVLLATNPLHHANSSATCDWAMRRPNAHIHLFERYSSRFWSQLTDIAESERSKTNQSLRLIAPMVSRHIDFLAELNEQGTLSVDAARLRAALHQADLLLGSAPVGPTTVARALEWSGRPPKVRFGSTETCLQVMGIPDALADEACVEAFRRGWSHGGGDHAGYFIGRPHPPVTDVRIVKSTTPEHSDYLKDCVEGESGLIITRGSNVMSGYVKRPDATRGVMHHGWYTGLQDVGFYLMNASDGRADFYWQSRESALLIRGGANYAYDQINDEIKDFLRAKLSMEFDVAVVGLRIHSEHEDTSILTIDPIEPSNRSRILNLLQSEASQALSKVSRPDYIRFASVPRNFKGAVKLPLLKEACQAWLRNQSP